MCVGGGGGGGEEKIAWHILPMHALIFPEISVYSVQVEKLSWHGKYH